MNELSDIKSYAQKAAVPIVRDGGCSFICDYITSHQVKTVLEIGTAIAYSAIRFAQCGGDVHVTTIERDEALFQQARQNIRDCGLESQITAIHGDALSVELDGAFDLIFIDGPKAQYINFFEKYKANLASGGAIISDNLSFHGMVKNLSLTHNYSTKKLVKKIRKYIAFLKTNEEFETEFFELGDGISVSRRKRAII